MLLSLSQRTSLPVDDIIDLLSFCLNTTYLVFDGIYCQKVFGTAMESPVSAVVANLVTEDVEQRTHFSLYTGIPLVDLSIISYLRFLEMKSIFYCNINLNSIEPSTQFTIDRDMNGDLVFLDLSIHRTVERKLETDVYCISTYTNKYLSYDSHLPVTRKSPW